MEKALKRVIWKYNVVEICGVIKISSRSNGLVFLRRTTLLLLQDIVFCNNMLFRWLQNSCVSVLRYSNADYKII